MIQDEALQSRSVRGSSLSSAAIASSPAPLTCAPATVPRCPLQPQRTGIAVPRLWASIPEDVPGHGCRQRVLGSSRSSCISSDATRCRNFIQRCKVLRPDAPWQELDVDDTSAPDTPARPRLAILCMRNLLPIGTDGQTSRSTRLDFSKERDRLFQTFTDSKHSVAVEGRAMQRGCFPACYHARLPRLALPRLWSPGFSGLRGRGGRHAGYCIRAMAGLDDGRWRDGGAAGVYQRVPFAAHRRSLRTAWRARTLLPCVWKRPCWMTRRANSPAIATPRCWPGKPCSRLSILGRLTSAWCLAFRPKLTSSCCCR